MRGAGQNLFLILSAVKMYRYLLIYSTHQRVGSKVWIRVSMIVPVKEFGKARLSTSLWETNRADSRERGTFLKFSKRGVYFMFKHLRKSSSCPTCKSWTFLGIVYKYSDVKLSARLQASWCLAFHWRIFFGSVVRSMG